MHSVNTIISLSELYRPIEEPLADVREAVGQLWLDALQLVQVDAISKPKVEGKLLRPAMCLLSAGATGCENLQRFVPMAMAYEALHIASLTHDDVVDHASLRRGASSLNALWSNHAAVLGGDYLMARAIETLADYGSCEVVSRAVSSIRRMAEGELLFFGRGPDDIEEKDCLELAQLKTASLFAEACNAPACVDAPELSSVLHQFGIAFGIAFQIVDDLLDLTQPSKQLGKPACGDVVEAKVTIPILFMRQAMHVDDKARMDSYREAILTEDDREWIMSMAQQTGAVARAEQVAKTFTDKAMRLLEQIPQSAYRSSLEGIVDFVIVRTC